jgi:hypothetical protein
MKGGMVVAKLTVTVCDECGSQEGVKHFDIKQDTRKAGVDLCETHSEWLDQLLGAKSQTSQTPTKRRTRSRKVMTMEEIEALKKSKSS